MNSSCFFGFEGMDSREAQGPLEFCVLNPQDELGKHVTSKIKYEVAPHHSSVGRASDCSGLQTSECPWFDSEW